ncbi:MAG: META domain-containing protein [Sphingobium sp.]
MTKAYFIASLMLCLPSLLQARTAPPPLTPDLFEKTWAVTAFDGKQGSDFVPIISFDGPSAFGDTGCETNWTARFSMNLPAVRFRDVEGDLKGCDDPVNASRFLDALRKVRGSAAGEDGLELRGPDGGRLLLLVAGG